MRMLTLDGRPTREAALEDPAGFVAGLEGPVIADLPGYYCGYARLGWTSQSRHLDR